MIARKHLSAFLIIGLTALPAAARPLPFTITLSSTTVSGGAVVSLRQVADAALVEWSYLDPEKTTLGSLQSSFENVFWQEAKRQTGDALWAADEWRVRQAVHKWVSTYALGASIQSQDLQALREELHSSAFVRHLAEAHMPIAEGRTTPEFEKDSQWCGSFREGCSTGELVKLVAVPGSVVPDFDSSLSEDVSSLIQSGSRDSQMHLLSYEILWDPPGTRVRYGVTFYLKETVANDQRSLAYLGYHLLYLHEATPALLAGKSAASHAQILASTSTVTVQEVASFLSMAASYPIGVAVGVKNAAFELAKMPFSFLGGFLGRGHPYEYPLRNLRSAHIALKMEVLHPQRLGLLSGIVRLLGELPIVGPVFQYNANPNHRRLDAPKWIFITRGIYGGNAMEQDTGLWAAATQHYYPEANVQAIPYEFGTITDVIWSMFNLSHGQAYVMADRIMETANRGDRLYLVGHSAGVQRITYASRLLGQRGYDVRQMMGIAGPSVGQADVNTLHPTPFKVLINPTGDIVSTIGLGAKGVTTLVDWVTRQPLKLVGGIFLSWDQERQEWWYRFMDRVGPSNAHEEIVIGGDPAKHETPLRLSLTSRVVYDRFIRLEYGNIFRDDLSPRLHPDDPAFSYQP